MVTQVARFDGTFVYTAWEPDAGHTMTIQMGGASYGRIGTCPLPTHLEAMDPLSEERSRAIKAWYRIEYQRAYNAIVAVYPNALAGMMERGEIVAWS